MSRLGTTHEKAAADGRDQVQQTVVHALRHAGLSQRRAAGLLGGHKTTVQSWARGRRHPTVVDLAQLAAACGLRLRLVLDGPDEEEVAC